MADVKFTAGKYSSQLLLNYDSTSLAPYTLVDNLCDINDTTQGMQLIYAKTLSDIEKSNEDGDCVLMYRPDDIKTKNPYKYISFKDFVAKKASDLSLTDDRRLGDNDKGLTSLGVVVINPGASDGKYTRYLPVPSEQNYNQALIYNSNKQLTWGAAGAILAEVQDSAGSSDEESSAQPHYIIAAGNGITPNTAPSTLYYDRKIFFKNHGLYHLSDERYKTFTEYLDVDLDNLEQIKKGIFYWKDDEEKVYNIGVTAQSVEALFPELVTEERGIRSVDYSKLSVVALAAIDKLNNKIKELEAELDKLKK